MESHGGFARLCISWQAESIACNVNVSVKIADTVKNGDAQRPGVSVQDLCQISVLHRNAAGFSRRQVSS